MPVWKLDADLWFPSPALAEEDGLLAIEGDLGPERLLLGYSNGIFPWYSEGDPILWWSPDPRFVLYPQKLRVSKTMQQTLRRNVFDFRFDTEFEKVMRNCASVFRKGEGGTWINEDMIQAYCSLHEMGFAHSAESWVDDRLVGGLYGVRLGKIFFGESMFSFESNASKAAFIQLVQQLQREGVVLIDCQMHTAHLESLGAEDMGRQEFLDLVHKFIN